MWQDLTLSDKARMIQLAVKSGITDLSTIQEVYNKFAEGGRLFRKGGNKVKVKSGDSWIKIANENKMSLADLLEYNGISATSREALPSLHAGQELYVTNPFHLDASYVSANAPEDYSDYGEKGRELITNYARAVAQGALRFKDVPDEYKSAVYQRGITLKTDKAADKIFKTGLNTALFLSNPIGYTTGYAAQKGIAYANDAISGRHEYGVDDLLGYTPVMGTEYASEHPMRAIAADVAAGTIGGAAIRNAGTIVNNARQAFQNAAATTGMERQVLSYPQFAQTKPTFGSAFQSGVKGSGKTGSQYAGRGASGYRPVVSSKGTFMHEASGTPSGVEVVGYNTPSGVLPVSPLPFEGAVPPISWLNREPQVIIKSNPKHIHEEQTLSKWQNPNYTGEIGPYIPGTGLITIKGDAPIGDSVYDQALTNETLTVTPGEYVPRKAVYVKDDISGTPSDIYSGLGIIYRSDNPKSLIFGTPSYAYGGNKYDDGGDKDIPYNGEIKQGKKWTVYDHWKADHPMFGHGARKAGVLLDDAARLMFNRRIKDVEIAPRKMTDFNDLANQFNDRDNPDSAVDRMSRVATPAGTVARIAKPLLNRLNEEVLPWAEGVREFANKLRVADRLVNMGQFIDDFATPVEQFKNGGYKIHIKKENRGKFTALKKRTGKSASWFKAHGTPAQKKMAVFALNARKWRHEDGGLMTKL